MLAEYLLIRVNSPELLLFSQEEGEASLASQLSLSAPVVVTRCDQGVPKAGIQPNRHWTLRLLVTIKRYTKEEEEERNGGGERKEGRREV